MVSYRFRRNYYPYRRGVLILIVVEDGLVLSVTIERYEDGVLILIVVEDGLVPVHYHGHFKDSCLNPYCSGRWSRTNKTTKIRVS